MPFTGPVICAARRFADGVGELLGFAPGAILLEAGPGQTLAPLARQHPAARDPQTVVLSTLHENRDDVETALGGLGRLWPRASRSIGLPFMPGAAADA